MIVQELRKIQERCGYLPTAELLALARRINEPLHRLHEVASFYPLYRLKPPPAAEVLVCRDMACHLHGAPRLTQNLQAYGQEVGGDQVAVKGVSCLGQCDRPIAVSINDVVYRGLSEAELRERMDDALEKKPLPHQHAERGPAGWQIDVYNGQANYTALRLLVEKKRDADAILKALEVAGLRGMGGAGFPTFRKWSAVRGAQADAKYVICNADESEPGTFKDRDLLRRAPHLLIEAMILAGLVVGAKQGYIYIRHEYHEEAEVVEEALKQARLKGVLGDNILGSGQSFHLEQYISPGGYVQGEESALLEAIEDRRGEPRNKPPFPVFSGLYNKPTVINNVETLMWIPGIILKGGEWYRDGGTHGATGRRFVSISGDVKRPGVYEVPFGQTVRELIIDTAGGVSEGQTLKAIAPSGPSGGFLPARIKTSDLPPKYVATLPPGTTTIDVLDVPLDLNSMSAMGFMLGAAFVVYGSRANMVEQALNCVEFYRNESCGKCVPCRIGSEKLVDIVTAMLAGRFTRQSLPMVQELADTMTLASICGLGQVASNPLAYVIKFFPEELARYLKA
jgi:formate dehydrogenase beta subunit